MDCILKSTGEHVPVICAMNQDEDETINFVPMVMMFTGNPYELLLSPMDYNEEAKTEIRS